MTERKYGLKNNQVRAVNRLVRSSAQKLNLVVETIRKLPVDKAIDVLTFSKKRVAGDVKKTLMSAVANAENNHGFKVENLVVSEAYVGKAIVMKRMRPEGKGRAGAILKPFSSVTIILESVEAIPAEKKTPKAKDKNEKKGDK